MLAQILENAPPTLCCTLRHCQRGREGGREEGEGREGGSESESERERERERERGGNCGVQSRGVYTILPPFSFDSSISKT